jgi:alkylation response protein AidB-like acyl-CoA dehydrogenase
MRAAFDAALAFATAERRGGPTPIIEHQNVGTILVDMKARLEGAGYLTWKACRAEWLDPHASRSGRNRIDLSSRAIHLAGVS